MLVEFYDLTPAVATAKVNAVIGRLAEDADFHPTKDIVYHAEPIHIAADIMGREVERSEEFYKTYRGLERQNLQLTRKRSQKRQRASLLQIPRAAKAVRRKSADLAISA